MIVLAGDIGGTNSRFALYEVAPRAVGAPEARRQADSTSTTYPSNSHSTLERLRRHLRGGCLEATLRGRWTGAGGGLRPPRLAPARIENNICPATNCPRSRKGNRWPRVGDGTDLPGERLLRRGAGGDGGRPRVAGAARRLASCPPRPHLRARRRDGARFSVSSLVADHWRIRMRLSRHRLRAHGLRAPRAGKLEGRGVVAVSDSQVRPGVSVKGFCRVRAASTCFCNSSPRSLAAARSSRSADEPPRWRRRDRRGDPIPAAVSSRARPLPRQSRSARCRWRCSAWWCWAVARKLALTAVVVAAGGVFVAGRHCAARASYVQNRRV